MALGARQDETLMRQLIQSVCQNQSETGGWTIRNARPVNLTTACAFALIALGQCGAKSVDEENAITRGADWLVQNLKPDGWPLYEGGLEVSCVATALAVRALHSVGPFVGSAAANALRQGYIGLEHSMLEDGCWGNCGIRDKGSAAATSHALVTLIKTADYAVYSEPVTRGLSWIRANKFEKLMEHDSADSFYVHMDVRRSAAIIYVHFTPALVLQSLLACEIDIVSDVTVKRLVEHLIEGQEKNGEWRSPVAPRLTPSWMLMDGALALSQFIKAVSDVRTSLAFRDELALIKRGVDTRVEDLDRALISYNARLLKIETTVGLHAQRLRIWHPTLTFISKGLPYLVLLTILVAYMIVRPYVQSHAWVDIVAIATAVILAAIGILATRARSEKVTNEVSFASSDQERKSLPTESERVDSLPSKRDREIEEAEIQRKRP
jgi:hypothetical protein